MVIKKVTDFKEIYNYQKKFHLPNLSNISYDKWLESFTNDKDASGRTLFKELVTLSAYVNDKLVGYIQYGTSSFGFDEKGEISFDISYSIIRNLYFDKDKFESKNPLIEEALSYFKNSKRIYAFFHYFGLKCLSRFGKLFIVHDHIEKSLKEYNFYVEHENIYYSKKLTKNTDNNEIQLSISKDESINVDFIKNEEVVGSANLDLVNDELAFLRYIYIKENLRKLNLATKSLSILEQYLLDQGLKSLDTDTSSSNLAAIALYNF